MVGTSSLPLRPGGAQTLSLPQLPLHPPHPTKQDLKGPNVLHQIQGLEMPGRLEKTYYVQICISSECPRLKGCPGIQGVTPKTPIKDIFHS